MKNLVPTTTNTSNNFAKTSKMSFADRLAMGEDIDNIVSDDETPTAENVSQPIESIIENHSQPLETLQERAERGTVKKATLELFESLSKTGEVDRSLWCQMAVDKGICKNVRQAANILRYDFLGIERVSMDGTIVNRTTLTVEQAEQKFLEVEKTALEDFELAIKKAKLDFCAKVSKAQKLCALAKENEAKKAEQDAKIAAQSVKKAGEVLKSLESIDTSKVEISPEMREMMMKMLGLTNV